MTVSAGLSADCSTTSLLTERILTAIGCIKIEFVSDNFHSALTFPLASAAGPTFLCQSISTFTCKSSPGDISY